MRNRRHSGSAVAQLNGCRASPASGSCRARLTRFSRKNRIDWGQAGRDALAMLAPNYPGRASRASPSRRFSVVRLPLQLFNCICTTENCHAIHRLATACGPRVILLRLARGSSPLAPSVRPSREVLSPAGCPLHTLCVPASLRAVPQFSPPTRRYRVSLPAATGTSVSSSRAIPAAYAAAPGTLGWPIDAARHFPASGSRLTTP
jgi:hypothetical protein